MKNQKAIIVTVALFIALISLSASAATGHMVREELGGVPRQPTPPIRRVQPGELGGVPRQPMPPVRRVQPGQPRRPFPPRLTKEQQIKRLENKMDWYKKMIDQYEDEVKKLRKQIREIKRRK